MQGVRCRGVSEVQGVGSLRKVAGITSLLFTCVFSFALYWGCFKHGRCGGLIVGMLYCVSFHCKSNNNISLSLFILSGNEPNGEPSTSRTDVHDETDFSMASLAKREVTQVCVSPLPPR